MANIPKPSQSILNRIKIENDINWQQDFYFRIIQPAVAFNIEKDFEDLKGLDLAKALQKWVNTAKDSTDASVEGEQLMDLLHRCNKLFPKPVKDRLTTVEMRKSANTNFQKLILLEILYKIQKLVNKQEKIGPLNSAWRQIDEWASKKIRSLIPSYFFSVINHYQHVLFGNFFENSFVWLSKSIPYFVKKTLGHFSRAARRFPNDELSLVQNGINFLIGTLQAGFLVLNMCFGSIFQVNRFFSHVTSIPIKALKKLVREHWAINAIFGLATFAKDSLFFLGITALLAPYLIQFLAYTFASYALFAIGVGSLLGIAHFCLNKIGIHAHFKENLSPTMTAKESLIMLMTSFSAGMAPAFLNQAYVELSELRAKHKVLKNKSKNIADNANPTPPMVAQRKAIWLSYKKWVYQIVATIDNYFSINTHILADAYLSYLRISWHLPQENGPQRDDAQQGDFNRSQLVGQILRMQANLNEVKKKYGKDVVDAVKKAKNPETYLKAFKRLKDLPKGLRILVNRRNPEPSSRMQNNSFKM